MFVTRSLSRIWSLVDSELWLAGGPIDLGGIDWARLKDGELRVSAVVVDVM